MLARHRNERGGHAHRNELARQGFLGALLALSTLACGPTLEAPEASEPPPTEAEVSWEEPLTPQWKHPDGKDVLVPTSDVDRDDVTGVPDRRRLYRNIDDGTDDDGSGSYVTLEKGRRAGDFTVGFSGGPEGTVKEVEVHYRAKRQDSQRPGLGGAVRRHTPLGRGSDHTLTATGGLHGPLHRPVRGTRRSLRARLFLEATSGRGGLRVTSLWLRVKVEPPAPEPTGLRRVDAFLFRDVSTCTSATGARRSECQALSDSSGTPRVRFADDGAYRAVPPGDPAIATAEVVQCVHLRLSDAEVAARRAELERYRDDVALWTGGRPDVGAAHPRARLRGAEPLQPSSGLWVSSPDARPVIFPFLSRDTDFVLLTAGVETRRST